MQLTGKVAAITGGSRGIGRGIAEAFLREGASVAINGRNDAKGKQALEELDAGDRAIFVQGDVRNKDDVDRFVDEAAAHFGQIDILVNNAGGTSDSAPVAELSDESWDNTIQWCVYSTFWATRRALAHMLPRQYGRIINISSVEGKHGKPGISHYVTAKHAINGFTKACAKEVATAGITVNALCPGLILTDVVRENGASAAASMGLTFDEMVDMFAQESAIKRLNKVEEVAAVAVLLASDHAAGVTGSLYNVDGGTAAY
ncbi:SDR family NAD(P)-dependent oxidoreductase [Actinophytocola sp.]|uniref:SDR family NAD(P)-dependent oxidoreductase n=1 Tax=Actinophytocola sp. TaxID=1872138 RepID=UPI002ED48768